MTSGFRSDPPSKRPAKKWLVLAVVLIVIAVFGLGLLVAIHPASTTRNEPGPPGPGARAIQIVPSDGSSSACIVDTPGQPRPTFDLQNRTLQANSYSVPNGTVGHLGMCYDAATGSLLSYANWTHVGAGGGWFSYPQVTYGVDYYSYEGSPTTYTPMSPLWELPQTVASTINESLWVTAAYSLRAPPTADVDGYDLSFDNFVSAGLPPTLSSGPPFVEVEIFLAHNISYPFHWATWSTPTLVNSTVVNATWDVAYYCHGTDNGSSASVSFDFSYGGQSTQGLAAGTIGLDLSAFFGQVGRMIPSAACWTGPHAGFPGMYLGEEDLGSEDGALGNTSFNYNWTISAYCLHPGVTAANVSAISCERPGPSSAVDGAGAAALRTVGGGIIPPNGPALLGGPLAVVSRDATGRDPSHRARRPVLRTFGTDPGPGER